MPRIIVFPNRFQVSVAITVLLVAFPACLGELSANEIADQQTQPLLSGSVCRDRDTKDFLSVSGQIQRSDHL